jgi:hypothetical protein
MALYALIGEEAIRWQVGTYYPTTKVQRALQNKDYFIVFVQADGDELSLILNSFLGLPRHNDHKLQIWHGDFARFILANLP